MAKKSEPNFAARGGWWVVAQFLLFGLIVVTPVWLVPEQAAAPGEPLFIAGVTAMIAGLLVSVLGARRLGVSLTPFPRPLAKSSLRTTGIYGWVRHPIYSGMILAALGWAIYYRSLAAFVWVPVLLAFFDRKAAREEIWLVKKFAGYAAYRQRVRKLIPGIY